jgi:hypothetical protein
MPSLVFTNEPSASFATPFSKVSYIEHTSYVYVFILFLSFFSFAFDKKLVFNSFALL